MLSETRVTRTQKTKHLTTQRFLNGFFSQTKKKRKKMSERLLCSNLILPPGDTSVTERLHNCGVPGWSLHIQFLLHSQTKRGADLLSSIVHFKDSGTDEEIMLLTCVSLDIYLQTLKQRHSIRIWSWEIWWRLKWIDTLGVRWWLSAKDDGTTNAFSLEHQGWVVENYSTTMYTRGTLF